LAAPTNEGAAALRRAPALGMLSAEDLAARLTAAAARPPVAIDDRPGQAPGAPGALTPAAVLVPIVAHPAPSVLLTLRGRHLKAHAGQVSFPGGRIEPTDPGPVAAALREAEEEIGLAPETVAVVGMLGDHVTGTGFRVTPVVALVSPPLSLRPDPSEVDEVFELPLREVLDPAAFSWREEVLLGRARRFRVVRHDRHLIWGATAAMLVSLREALGALLPG
jgi:8-oxo-dGTP pyrophosphatase MutT (NUDIX family)